MKKKKGVKPSLEGEVVHGYYFGFENRFTGV